jgi:hypothetical protein
MKQLWLAAALVLAGASPVLAQGAFVSASLTGDIVRFSHTETGGTRDLSGSGEAVGFALRVGTTLGSNWGVDGELARPSTIENEGEPDVVPLAYTIAAGTPGAGGLTVSDSRPLIYPPISYRVRTSQRNMTWSAGLWARQELTSRAALVYSGGVAFHRTTLGVEIDYGPSPGLILVPIVLPPARTEATVYNTRPYAGVEGRVGMTDHVQLVAGVRVHGLQNGVLVRPAVGLGWMF